MRKGSELLGLPIICINDGDKVAEVKEVIYSKNRLRILGFIVKEGNFFREPEIIKFKNVDSIGKDALMIKNIKVIESATTIPEINEQITNKSRLIGEEVISDDGESLGFIQDVIIDEEKGRIFGFVLTEGLIQDIVDGRNILPYINGIKFGKDSVILDSKIKEDFIKNKKEFKKLLELQ